MTSVIPKISQLSSRVIRVLGCNPGYFTLQGTNTYIVGTGKNRLLVDCGEPDIPEYLTNLKNVVRESGISLSKILLTHWHPDHVGGTKGVLSQVAEEGCKVYKYQDLEHDSAYSDDFELTYLKNEDEVSVEGATIKVHWTPGHAQDHLVLVLKEENTMFSGDCVLGEGTVVFEDLKTYLESLRKILSLNPKKLYPGHGPVVNDPVLKVNEYIDKRMAREKEIVEVLLKTDGYISALDIVKQIYQDLPSKLIFGAEYSVRNHLEKLIKDGIVEAKEEVFTFYKLKEGVKG